MIGLISGTALAFLIVAWRDRNNNRRLTLAEKRVEQLVAIVGGGQTAEAVGLLPAGQDVATIRNTLEALAPYQRFSIFKDLRLQWCGCTLEQINSLLDLFPYFETVDVIRYYQVYANKK